MNEETAFFRFDTNANAVAGDVVGAMTRINQALTTSPSGQSRLGADIAGFQQAYSRLEQDVVSGTKRIQTALSQVGQGLMTPAEFRQQYATIGQEVFAAQRRTIADELALMPRQVANRLPIGQIMADVATSTASTLRATMEQSLNLANGAMDRRNIRSATDFGPEIAQMGMRPVDYGWSTDGPNGPTFQSRQLQLINQLRAESILRSDPAYGLQGQAAASRMGFDDQYMRDLQERATRETAQGRAFVGTTATAELNDLVTASRQAEAAGRRMESQMERETREAIELAAALALVESGYKKYGTVMFTPDGEAYRRKGLGATSEVGAIPLAEAQAAQRLADQRRENEARLLANLDEVTPVGGYRVLGEDVYRRAPANSGYDKVERSEIAYTEAMNRAADARAREAVRALRLNELSDSRALRDQQVSGGPLTGFLARFNRGDQTFGNSMGAQVASAAAFSVAYGSIFALTGAMQQLLQEYLDYQDSLTDLEVATRSADVVTGNYVNTLSEMSRLAGGNVGQAMDTAARGIRAFSEAGDSADKTRAIGDATNTAATQLALIANKSLPDATGDVVAIGSAFGLDADQLNQVVDAVANAKRNVGGDAAQISQGLSLVALSAQEAGFSLNEAAAVIGLVQARTDQSGQAIATRLTRVFQIVSGSTGKNLARDLGVNSNQSVKEQIEDFAKIYANEDTSEAIKDRISSGLGGTANLREILPLLKENERLQRAYREAINNAGQGTDEFNRKSGNLVGTLKQLSGDVKNIAVSLGQSGLFDSFGILLTFLEPTLNGFDTLLKSINSITEQVPYLQTVLGLLVNAAIAAKAIGVISATNAVVTGGSGGKASPADAARARESQAINAATQQRLVAEKRLVDTINYLSGQRAVAEKVATTAALGDGAVVAGGAAAGTMRSGAGIARNFVTALNPVGIAATIAAMGGFALIGQLSENRTTLQTAQNAAINGGLAIYDRADGSAESLRNAQQDLRSNLGQIEKTDVAFYYEDEKAALVELTQTRLDGISYIARLVESEERLAAKHQDLTVFGDSAVETVDELAKGLAAIAANGGTGVDQFRALSKVLTTPPDQMKVQWQPERLFSDVQNTLLANVQKALPEGAQLYGSAEAAALAGTTAGTAPTSPTSATAAQALGQAYANPYSRVEANATSPYGAYANYRDLAGVTGDPKEISAALTALSPEALKAMRRGILDELDAMGVDTKDILTPEMKARLAEVAVKYLPNVEKLGEETSTEFLLNLAEMSAKDLNGGDKSLKRSDLGINPEALNGPTISRRLLNSFLNQGEPVGEDGVVWPGFQAVAEQALADIPANDDGRQREALLGNIVKTLENRMAAFRRSGDKRPHGQIELLLANFSAQYAESAVARIEDMREAAESRAETNKELRAIRLKFAKRAFAKAAGNPNLLESLMESLDRQTLDQVRNYLVTAVETARAAFRHAQRLQATAEAMLQLEVKLGTATPEMEDPFAGLRDRLNTAKDDLKDFDYIDDNFANVTEDKAYLPEVADTADAAEEAKKTAEERARERADLISAKAAAAAARRGGGIAAAQAALTSARADVNAAKKGTTEYFQALASLYEAQWQMTEALQAYRSNLHQLEGDMTDPVEQARDALRAARDRLAAARSKDEKAAARVEAEQSEYALEKARWDQKLSDMQIAQQLGDISYAQYVRYLEREAQRMDKMKNKTRQQIDYMNQIELALQEAQQAASSQFNLGDISTNGFVYQTRRWAAQQRAGLQSEIVVGGAAQMVNSNNNVTINGTDTRLVRQVLREMLGDGSTQTRSTNSARRGG